MLFFCAEKIEPKADFNEFTVVCIFNEYVVKMKREKKMSATSNLQIIILCREKTYRHKKARKPGQHLLLFSPSLQSIHGGQNERENLIINIL